MISTSRLLTIISYAIVTLLLLSCTRPEKTEQPKTTDSSALSYTILTTLPHDTEAFTEGLEIHNDNLLESTGRNGNSWIAETDPTSGKPDKRVIVPEQYFGEGITVLNNKLYHLT